MLGKLYPPIIDYKKPKAETIFAFLKGKGWTLEAKTQFTWIMRPPEDLAKKTIADPKFHIPFDEQSISYEEVTFSLLEGFAELYDLPLQDLFNLLSLSVNDIKREVEEYPKMLELKRSMIN